MNKNCHFNSDKMYRDVGVFDEYFFECVIVFGNCERFKKREKR